ncbi:YlmH family RNA-binding protein [Alkalihalobacterium bogoriense]|uniref:YlmH family RNA-binding protein n=1 Tax=Alkalihalobacterium bogoriense TaxID=246272 RepID=UPI000478E032|nr:RNA-binding protein [Alkalihalobacterium bogoriense]
MTTIYQHFREDERAFVDKVLDWKADAEQQYRRKLTDFLDPREQEIMSMLIGKQDDVRLSFWGGSTHSERKRALLLPPYDESDEEEEFNIVTFELEYPQKFVTIEHRDVLGSLMSLGMKREKFGDILFEENRVQIITQQETADFIEANLHTIGRASIELNRIPNSEQIKHIESWEEQVGTFSSLRLDVVLSEIYRLSRAKTIPYIERGLVKVNWKIVEQSAFQLQQGDHISMRGHGRSKLISIEGKTKKDKWRILYGKLK